MITLLYLYIFLSTPQTRRISSVNSTTVLTKPSIQLRCGECPVGAWYTLKSTLSRWACMAIIFS